MLTAAEQLDGYLYGVMMTNEELSHIKKVFAEFRTLILDKVPGVIDAQMMGSVTRGTRLSERVAKGGDVDCLLQLDESTEIAPARTINEKVAGSLEANIGIELGAGSIVLTDRLFPRVTFKDVTFELVPVRGPVLSRYLSEWEFENVELIESYYGDFFASTTPGSRFIMHVIDPWDLNQLVPPLMDQYGDTWLKVVLLWKYWKLKSGSSITSYIVEANALRALTDAAEPSGTTTLQLAATVLRETSHYDYSMFSSDINFVQFRQDVLDIALLSQAGDESTAMQKVNSLFGVPQRQKNRGAGLFSFFKRRK